MIFKVHSVRQIHRISWGQIEKPPDMYQGIGSQIIGVVKQEYGMVLLLVVRMHLYI
jgi:two-component system chemotaxis response regulator CheV